MSTSQDEIYIDAPDLISRQRKLGDALATGLMWVLYTYLWAPLISLVAWLLGFEFAYNVMIRLGGINTLPSLLAWYVGMIAFIVLAVVIWSVSNRLRFSESNRRKAIAPVTDAEIEEFFDLETSMLLAIRDAQVCRVTLNEQAGFEQIESEDASRGDADPEGQRQRVHDRSY